MAARIRRPRLVRDAGQVARRSWAVRLSVLSAVLSGIEVYLNVMTSMRPSGRLAAAAALVSVGAAVARIVHQHSMSSSEDTRA